MPISDTIELFGQTAAPSVLRSSTGQTRKIQGFSYPIVSDPGNGYFTKGSGLGLIKAMVSNLIRTSKGERFMLPDYGANLRKFLMEPLDEVTFNLIREEIEIPVRKYLPFLSLSKIQVFETRGNNINVKLFLSFKDAKSVSFDVGIRV